MADPTNAEQIDFMATLLDTQGIAYSRVKDGHVLMISRSKLLAMLAVIEERGSDSAVVFIQSPEHVKATGN